MRQVNSEFLLMIKSKMGTDNLGIRELARLLGVSHPTVTEVVTYGNMPSFDTCNALSAWLGIPQEVGLRKSGLLPPKVYIDEWVEEQAHKMSLLTPGKRPGHSPCGRLA
jgi:hypothetical protein